MQYVIHRGDTFTAIARRFEVPVAAVRALNPSLDPRRLAVGQIIQVPDQLPAALFGARAVEPATLALVPAFERAAGRWSVPASTLMGLGFVESAWRQAAINSRSGAAGICQLLPSTANWVVQRLAREPLDLRNAADNIHLGACYLGWLHSQFGSSTEAVAAYTQGQGSVRRGGISDHGRRYVAKVNEAAALFEAVRNPPTKPAAR